MLMLIGFALLFKEKPEDIGLKPFEEEDKEAAKGKTIVDTDQGEVWFDCSIYGGSICIFTGGCEQHWKSSCSDKGY